MFPLPVSTMAPKKMSYRASCAEGKGDFKKRPFIHNAAIFFPDIFFRISFVQRRFFFDAVIFQFFSSEFERERGKEAGFPPSLSCHTCVATN